MPRPKIRPARSPSTTSEDEVTSAGSTLDLSNGSSASSFSTEENLSALFDRLNSYIDSTDAKPKQIFRDLGKAPIITRKAMFDLLVDNKESIADLLNERAEIVRKQISQSEKLDNMLFDCLAGAELGPPSPEPGEPDPPNDGQYKFQLQAIKIKHTEMLEELEESRGEAEQKIEKMVDLQIPFRPISKEDHKRMIETSTARYSDVEERMKKSTASSSKLYEGNDGDFDGMQHLNHPYPTDEEKNQLSYQCNISVQQITNWFGNRRVRQKRQADRPLQPPTSSPKRKDSGDGPKNKNHLKGNRALPRLEKQRRMSSPGPRQLLAVPLQQQHMMLHQVPENRPPSLLSNSPCQKSHASYRHSQQKGEKKHPELVRWLIINR
uniref:Homeobox domain-containing protein n=1 Tax=Pristionchus pacificus TaxID=54126 RepID=A0A8R1UIN2_PRIPA